MSMNDMRHIMLLTLAAALSLTKQPTGMSAELTAATQGELGRKVEELYGLSCVTHDDVWLCNDAALPDGAPEAFGELPTPVTIDLQRVQYDKLVELFAQLGAEVAPDASLASASVSLFVKSMELDKVVGHTFWLTGVRTTAQDSGGVLVSTTSPLLAPQKSEPVEECDVAMERPVFDILFSCDTLDDVHVLSRSERLVEDGVLAKAMLGCGAETWGRQARGGDFIAVGDPCAPTSPEQWRVDEISVDGVRLERIGDKEATHQLHP